MPQVSVIMPVYNGERFLGDAIESVLSQTFSDFEFIIVDDCSRDSSAEIATAFAKDDSRVRFLPLKENVGAAQARNSGGALARGAYLAGMDADDISLPERLRLQVRCLRDNPEIGVVGVCAQEVDEALALGTLLTMPQTHR